jgi:hypothetical protein
MNKHFLLLLTSLWAMLSSLHADPPVRGFPTGDEVLNKITPHPQVEPHLVYEENGFDDSILHEVPPVGVHPRVDMSPKDVVELREDIKSHAFTKRAWERLIEVHVKDRKGKMLPIEKIKRLDGAALYALVLEDAEYGKKVADAITKKAVEVREKLEDIDKTHAYPQHWWFSVRKTGIIHLAAAYDYGYNFMTDEQRREVRAVISRATKGRYNHGMELPRAFRTWNWPQFSQNIVNVALAIEGEEGYEPRIFEVCKESVVDFLTYKISPEGWDFEATGYNGLAWGGGGVQSLHAVARRLSPNPLMHPHLQAQTAAYIGQLMGPKGPWFGRGDAGKKSPQFEFTHLMRAFYPKDKRMKMLWQVSRDQHNLGPKKVKGDLRGSLGIPVLIYPVDDTEKAIDHWGDNANAPLTYEAPSRGYMGTRSSWDPKDSIHMTFANYTKMRDTGHDGPDGGTFSIWGYGVDWSRYGNKYYKDSAARSYIAVDSKGLGYGTPHGLFLPVVDRPKATAGIGDMTYCFQYQLANGRYNVLYSPIFEKDPSFYTNEWTRDKVKSFRAYEPDATPFSKEFWSLASTNYGLWNGEDRHPTRRIPFMPMKKAFRSSTLVRGDTALNGGNGYPYVLTVDDIQQDENLHLYNWLMPLDSSDSHNEVVKMSGDKGDQSIIVRRVPVNGDKTPLKKGESLLMVKVLQRNQEGFPGIRLDNIEQGWNGTQRIVVPSVSVAPDFKVLIYPHRHGDPLPKTTWNANKTSLKIEIGQQVDNIDFAKAFVDRRPFGGQGEQTYFNLYRKGEKLITVGGPPSLPQFVEASRDFDGSMTVAFKEGQAGSSLFYTTDGSEPTKNSKLYTGPFIIDETITIKAITFAPGWKHGDKNSRDYQELVSENFILNKPATYRPLVSQIDEKASRPVSVTYTKASPQKSRIQASDVGAGIDLKLYELPITIWRGSKVDLKSPLMPSGLEGIKPIFHTYQKNLVIPRIKPTVEQSKMYNGLYVVSGYFKAHVDGRYFFKMKSCGPTHLKLGSKKLIEELGPYGVAQKHRTGEVYLSKGLHAFEAVFNDPSYFVSPILPVLDFSLSVKAPDSLTYRDLAPEQLFRDKDFSFSIADTILEVGQALHISNEKAGAIEVSLNGGASYAPYTEALVFNQSQKLSLKVRRRGTNDVISKNITVVDRLPALARVPDLKAGMIQRRYLRNVKAEWDISVDHNNMAKGGVSTYPKPANQDIFALVEKASPQGVIAVTEMLPDNIGGVIRRYTGYWWAPKTGLYQFSMLNEGSNKLLIDNAHVTSNHNFKARPEGKVILAAGWHKFEVMYEDSFPGIWVDDGSGPREIHVTDFYYDADTTTFESHMNELGLPSSFLVGSWFPAKGSAKGDERLQSNIYGASPSTDAGRSGAYHLSGDKSIIHATDIAQTSEDLTLSMWIKPEHLKGTQTLWSRQKSGWVYSQRGGIGLRLVEDRVGIIYYGRNRPQTYAQVKAGQWQHLALTVKSDTRQKKAKVELWLNGEKVHSEVHGHLLNISTYYMEFLAQVERGKADARKNARLSYEDFKDSLLKNAFKGHVSDLRLYDAVLSEAKIKALNRR